MTPDACAVLLPTVEARRLKGWARLCLWNLLIVSALGILLRYKGAFPLPVVDYKYLLNAHSHFAFAGWVTTALFTALLYVLARGGVVLSRVYRYQFWFNQAASFGMLISFICEGYDTVSIFFSAMSVVSSYWFAVQYWIDLRKCVLPGPVKAAIRLALFFLVLSSAGPFLLAYSMSHGVRNAYFYYNAIYLYLHFQYNGWFSLAVIALLFWYWFEHYGAADRGTDRGTFRRLAGWVVGLLGGACVPAYCLSLLWMDPPRWVWLTGAVAGIAQVAALTLLIAMVLKISAARRSGLPHPVSGLWWLALVSLSIKIVLQALTVIPSMGRFAFSFRPVIIAYLHLVLLGFVSCAVLGFFRATGISERTRSAIGLGAFVTGMIANEAILLLQALLALAHIAWYGAPFYLLGAAVCMFAGLLGMVAAAPSTRIPFTYQ